MIVGLTGGIASGKSLVTEFLRELNVPVIDTDEIARQVVAPGQPAWRRLQQDFGPEYFFFDGQLDRAKLARRVFTDAAARLRLEEITHPAIFMEVDRQVASLRMCTPAPSLIFVVVPLLFEVGAESHFDVTVLVCATPPQQRERLVRQRGYTPEEAEARIAAQLSLGEKRRRADFQIENTGSIEALRQQVIALVQHLQHVASSENPPA